MYRTDLAEIIPTVEDVELRMPSDPVPSGLVVGEMARFYTETYKITRNVNGMVYVILSVLGDIVQLPPTSSSDSQAVWGPYTPALEPISFRLTVSEVADGEYEYVFQARPKQSTDEEDWVDLIQGSAFPSPDRNGHGQFTLDWTGYHDLNPHVQLSGQMEVVYDHRPQSFRTVEVIFTDLVDLAGNAGGDPVSGTYRYSENDDTSGDFQFAFLTNLHDQTENLPLPETLQVRTRWEETGEGRSDVRVSGVEVASVLTETLELEQDYIAIGECCDELFLRTWYDETPVRLTDEDGTPQDGSWDGPGQGDPADCPYSDSLFADDDVTMM